MIAMRSSRLFRLACAFVWLIALPSAADAAAPEAGTTAAIYTAIGPQAVSAEESKSPPAVVQSQLAEKAAAALRRAITDLVQTFGARYPAGPDYLKRLAVIEQRLEGCKAGALDKQQELAGELVALRREALLANPLLDFEKLLLIKRGVRSPDLGLPANFASNATLKKTGYDDALCVLTSINPDGKLTTLFKPDGGRVVADVDLHFDAAKLLFSMPGKHGCWQVCEIRIDDSGFREITGEHADVDSYDACYLPNGRILFASTACYNGVPCMAGTLDVANLYVMDADGKNIRQVTFDQVDDWCPTVLPNGRVLYLRWEYADTPHYATRLLFHMNPDGTGQREYYGSNSYWPNGIFYARPMPGHPTKVAGIVTGHHGVCRMGELVIFDPAQGRHQADGVAQRIPGYGEKVEPIILDRLVDNSWPKFLHPYPLSEKYLLVSAKPTPQSLWGVYLVDVFDNMVLIKEEPGYALLEPLPLRKTAVPPVVPATSDHVSKLATVHLADVYHGDGLKGIPRGTVKSLRVFAYHYAYRGVGGSLGVVGIDGPWDVKRILGTVPVHEDGSACFYVPPYTPISVQPLDKEGKAVQLMRSWMTAMPGEVLSCTGCHEKQNTAPPVKQTLALERPPLQIRPWYGPARGFSYRREVQPVIDKYCVGCHNGRPWQDGSEILDLRGTQMIDDYRIDPNYARHLTGKFTVGYAELHRFVRRSGLESDYHLLTPMEFHADTTELVQMLKKGHHNVRLDREAWDRLITWIDLNCPFHGTWGEEIKKCDHEARRRRELQKLYAGMDDDPEAVPQSRQEPIEPILPEPLPDPAPSTAGDQKWTFDAVEARGRQTAAAKALGVEPVRTVELSDGVLMRLVLIPAGDFIMGSAHGTADERPLRSVRIGRPFWLGACEVTNGQFAQFDPHHDSRVESRNNYQFGVHGIPANRPGQPVVRVSWDRAAAFCQWLSKKTGEHFSLPTEAQWEYACRAGTSTPFSFGDADADFSRFANLADAKLSEFALNAETEDQPLPNPSKYDDWIPKDTRFNDGSVIAVEPGKYEPNAWGLLDMHGNVAEWTRSSVESPESRTRSTADISVSTPNSKPSTQQIVRGGSWRDRPWRSTSSFRLSYPPYQRIYNVGFRVVCEIP